MLKFKTKKSLGQHFLINDKIYRFMAQGVLPEKKELILEIGPGMGALTEYLAKSEAEVLAIEKDRRLIPILREKFKNQKNVKIVEEDILKFNPTDYKLKTLNYKLIGNIPYYLTSHLLKIVLDLSADGWPKPKLILFMVQKEIAKRITAKPPKMNLLALAVQFYAEAKIVKNVSRNNFRPRPKVDSAIIKIIPKRQLHCSNESIKKLFQIARAAFSNKRKQILNSLVNNLKLDPEEAPRQNSWSYEAKKTLVAKKLAEAEIDSARRPESLNIAEWEKLTNLLFPEPPSV